MSDCDAFHSQEARVNDEGYRVVLCIYMSKQKIGAACFDAEQGTIHYLNDIDEDMNEFTILTNVLCQVQPTTLLLSSGIGDSVLRKVAELQELQHDLDNDQPNPCAVKLPTREFELSLCKEVVINLFASSNMGVSAVDGQTRSLFAVDFDATCMVRSLGVIIRHCNINGVLSNGVSEINSSILPTVAYRIVPLELYDILSMDACTFEALQIFKNESHPSVYKAGCGGTKEGFSLFAICNRCMNRAGSFYLRRIFRQPIRNVDILRDRLDAIQFLADERNIHLVNIIQKALRHVRTIGGILYRLRVSTMLIGDWASLHTTLVKCVYIIDVLKNNRTDLPNLLNQERIDAHSVEEVRKLCLRISAVIDFASLRRDNRVSVREGVDEVLDEKKMQYEKLPEVLTKVAEQEVNQLPFETPECTVVYAPMIGYLVAVPRRPEWRSVSDYQQPGMQFLFVSNNRVHYKTASVERLDVELGDLRMDIVDRELSIMLSLQNDILENATTALQLVSQAILIDCLLALAVTARELNWVRPELHEERELSVAGGRHPLVEFRTSPFVNNPIQSGNTQLGLVHIITGPNAAGKSVYIKQVGLIVFLAHIGSFVPAVSAKIPMTDRILSRLHSVDSVFTGMSTFAYDLKQMAVAVNSATCRSLVLIDEFGKGTSTEIGLSLLASCLQHWLETEDQCPHVFVCTHIHALLGMLPRSLFVKFKTMKVVRKGNELIYLYSIEEGYTIQSYAAYAARKCGLSEEVINRIHKIYQDRKQQKPLTRPGVSVEQMNLEYKESEALVNLFLDFELLEETVPALIDHIKNKLLVFHRPHIVMPTL
uniref:DNA_MISMATCH_REPAIR_2 domain-containing protein n=1 Tax=Trichuris muris TaxID=70415 RepID=A0A5S6QAN8_TRIMR